jgi:predicted dehydrogenase
MKVGVVGCGKIATAVHLPSIRKIQGYELVAAADVNQVRLQEVKEKFSVNETYDDYRRMLVKADIDAVFVCAPPEHHFRIVMDAIEWGKHVFCEKPLATNVDDANAIKEAFRMQQKTAPEPLFLMPAHNFIFTPCFIEALKLIENGEIGKVRKISGCSATNLAFYGAKTDFRTRAKCGVIEDLLPHLIYLVHRVGGSMKRVDCIEPRLRGGFVGDVDVDLTLRDDVEASLTAKWTGLVPTLALNLIGENGEIKLDVLRTPYNVTVVRNGEAKTSCLGRRVRQYVDVLRFKHPSYASEHLHFLSLVEKGVAPQVTVDDGIELVRTLTSVADCFQSSEACQSSAQNDMVAVLRAGDNVEETVKQSIEMLGGIRGVKNNDLVVIKPNICFPKNLKNMINTDLKVLEAVINIVKQKSKNVVVVESDSASGTAEKKAAGVGVLDLVRKLDVQFLNLSHDEVEEHRVADLPVLIPKTVLKADYMINVPKVKTNSFVVLSIAMKNMFGIIASKQKSQFHKRLSDVLVYLNRTVRQDLVVADGIVAMEGLGPIQGKPVDLGLIVAGKSPITVDAACCRIMDFNPYAVEPLWKAHQQGMGEIDAEKIRFLGENLDSIRHRFVLPQYSRQNLVQALKTEMQIRLGK